MNHLIGARHRNAWHLLCREYGVWSMAYHEGNHNRDNRDYRNYGDYRKKTRMMRWLPVVLLLVVLLAFRDKAPEIESDQAPVQTQQAQEESSVRTDGQTSLKKEKESNISESWTGDDKDGVAEYLASFQELPSNFMTKKEARKKGWDGGALHLVVPGMCIGGDVYGNYEGNLPEKLDYHECDIDTLKSDSRGAKRLVFSIEEGDVDIWYTADHYESFELIYGDGE